MRSALAIVLVFTVDAVAAPIDDFLDFVRAEKERLRIPGVAVAVIDGGEVQSVALGVRRQLSVFAAPLAGSRLLSQSRELGHHHTRRGARGAFGQRDDAFPARGTLAACRHHPLASFCGDPGLEQ